MTAGGSKTKTTRDQSLCSLVSVSTSRSTRYEIVGDTEQAVVNESGSQNQKTQIEILRIQMEKNDNTAAKFSPTERNIERIANAICLTNQCTKSKRVNKGKDMQVPLLKNNSLADHIRWKRNIEWRRGCVQIDIEIQATPIIMNIFTTQNQLK